MYNYELLMYNYILTCTSTCTHTLASIFYGTLHRRKGLYTVQTVFSIALHLTGNNLLFQIFNTRHSLFYKLVSWWGPKKCPHKVKMYWYYYLCHTHLTLKTWSSSSRSSELLQLPLGTEITFSTEPTSAERHREALTRATTNKDSLGFHQCTVNILPVPMNITS